jgi:hypothetical protein
VSWEKGHPRNAMLEQVAHLGMPVSVRVGTILS